MVNAASVLNWKQSFEETKGVIKNRNYANNHESIYIHCRNYDNHHESIDIHCRNYLASKSFDSDRPWWRLFHKCLVQSKLDI